MAFVGSQATASRVGSGPSRVGTVPDPSASNLNQWRRYTEGESMAAIRATDTDELRIVAMMTGLNVHVAKAIHDEINAREAQEELGHQFSTARALSIFAIAISFLALLIAILKP